jgi:PAS domain S-box-containing protein
MPIKAQPPPNEKERLEALHACGLLDTPKERAFDDFVRLAAHICGVPISAISFVDADRQWFKASVGLPVRETPRDAAFCAHTILTPSRMLVVDDAARDERFVDNPLVTGAPHIRFYAGATLVDAEGFPLGSLCVMDTVPRRLTEAQLDALSILARQIIREIESRRLVVDLAEQKSALDHHAVVAIADTRGRLTYVNDRFCALTRRTRDQLLEPDWNPGEGTHPARALFSSCWRKITSGVLWRGEIEGVNSAGQPYWLQATIVPMKDAEGKPWQFVAIGTDITERKRAEETLRRSEHWSRELVDALPAAVYTTDTEGRITMFNRAAVEFSGRVPRIGSDSWCVSWKLYTADGTPLPHDQCPMAVALKTGRPVRGCEAIAERPDGTRVNFIPYPTPLHDASGALLGAVNMLVDITARKRDEETLALLGSALQQAQESILITDADLELPGPRILFVNEAFTAMTGYSAADVAGKSPRISQGPRTDRAVIKRLKETLARGGTFQGETINYRKDGSAYDLEWQVAPIRNRRGVITHFVAVQRDISARKVIEAELERAREAALESARLKSRFLANMSHELRTPLNTINGLSATLAEQDLPPHARQAAGMILQCGETLLENIQTILTHSSLEAGKTRLESRPFAIAGLVLNALRITGNAAQRKGIDLDFNLSPHTPAELVGDPFRLQQVLVNLVANAIKFTDAGRVCLRLRSRPLGGGRHTLRITVADTGIGILPEALGRLFKPFSQADDSSTRRYEGTGLGLVITKSLVELMGGHITVRSRPDVGSLFSFSIVLPAVAGARGVFAAFAGPALAGRRLLIGEPQSVRRRQLVAMARAWDMRVTFDPGEPCDLALLRIDREGVPPAGAPVVWLCPSGHCGTPPPTPGRAATLCSPFGPGELSDALASVLRPETALPAAAASAALLKLGERMPLRILAADDMHSNRMVLDVICSHLGYKIELVENGAEALGRLEKETYDLVLLDVQMPVLDGVAAAREINRRYPDRPRRPRLVAMTASAQPGDREHCLEAGMDDYLGKPVLPRHLQECIERLFGERPSSPARDFAAAETVPSSPPEWIDLSHHRATTEGLDAAAAGSLLAQLHAAARADYEALRPRVAAACAARDPRALHACVHGLKGCAVSLGWTRLAAHCIETLRALNAETFDRWEDFPARLEGWVEATSAAFERVRPPPVSAH